MEEFKGSPAFEELLRKKSKWALMELAGDIMGEFKDWNPHMDFQDYGTIQPYFAYEAMLRDPSVT